MGIRIYKVALTAALPNLNAPKGSIHRVVPTPITQRGMNDNGTHGVWLFIQSSLIYLPFAYFNVADTVVKPRAEDYGFVSCTHYPQMFKSYWSSGEGSRRAFLERRALYNSLA